MALGKAQKLLDASTSTETGSGIRSINSKRAVQVIGSTSSGTGSATIAIEGSLDGTNYLCLGTITLSLTTTDSNDGFVVDGPWLFTRADLTAISGTGASVTCYLADEG